MAEPQPAVHRTILVVDIEKFSDRTGDEQRTVAEALSTLLEESFAEAGIDWSTCERNGTGDGVLVLVPADVAKRRLVDQLPHRLVAKLTSYNATRVPKAQMRLRVALHAGEVRQHADGFVGKAINLTFRLNDSSQLRAELAGSPGTIALIVSEWFYEQVVRDEPAAMPGSYKEVQVEVKETRARAWIRLPDGGVPANGGVDIEVAKRGSVERLANGLRLRPDEFRVRPGDEWLVSQLVAAVEQNDDSIKTVHSLWPLPAHQHRAVSQRDANFALVEALVAVPSILHENPRRGLLDELPLEIVGAIAYHAQAKQHVMNIVKTCLNYPGGLAELLDVVHRVEGGSRAVAQLDETVATLLWHLTHWQD